MGSDAKPDRKQDRGTIAAALANLPKKPMYARDAANAQEAAHRDRPDDCFISLKEVSAMVGLGRSTIYSLEQAGPFPKKIHVTEHAVRYKVGDIREWMRSLEYSGNAKEKQPEVLTERQQHRLMRLALKRVQKPPPKALPYYTMGAVMRLAGFTHSQIYDGVRNKRFPRWKKTGWPAQQWGRRAVDVWLETQKRKKRK